MAILDDLHIVSKPERLGTWHSVAQRELWAHCRIQVHWGKTHVWNRAGQNQRRATGCREWQKFMTPQLGCGADQRCLLPNRMSRFSAATVLVELPTVPDVQSAWVLLLHCKIVQLRVVGPELVNSFAEIHDQRLWRCLCAIVGVPSETCDGLTRATATLPLSLGGLGLRSCARTQESAYWASWADPLSMVQARHPRRS